MPPGPKSPVLIQLLIKDYNTVTSELDLHHFYSVGLILINKNYGRSNYKVPYYKKVFYEWLVLEPTRYLKRSDVGSSLTTSRHWAYQFLEGLE